MIEPKFNFVPRFALIDSEVLVRVCGRAKNNSMDGWQHLPPPPTVASSWPELERGGLVGTFLLILVVVVALCIAVVSISRWYYVKEAKEAPLPNWGQFGKVTKRHPATEAAEYVAQRKRTRTRSSCGRRRRRCRRTSTSSVGEQHCCHCRRRGALHPTRRRVKRS